MRSLYLFTAPIHEWGAAKAKAIAIGREHEEEFVNGLDRKAAWRLVEVETLDMVPTPRSDGMEVYSEFAESDQNVAWTPDSEFDPGAAETGQSGVWPWDPGEDPEA